MQYTIQTQKVNSLSSSFLKKFVLFKLDFFDGKDRKHRKSSKNGKIYVVRNTMLWALKVYGMPSLT